MPPPTTDSRGSKDWYKVSTETLRGCGVVLLAVVVIGGSYVGYRVLKPQLLRREAALVMEEARHLLERLEGEDGLESFFDEYASAGESLEQAQSSFQRGDFEQSLASAKRCRAVLSSILDALLNRRPSGEAQFISAHGRVEFRRGERGEWQPAGGRSILRPGDYVKTGSNGSAEVMFVDGTLYTVRPNTLFVVTGPRQFAGLASEQTIAMEYGWVNLSTSQVASRVATPGAEARLDRESEGLITYDQGEQVGRFAAFSGGMEVTSPGGERRTVQAREQVTLAGGGLSLPAALPERPELGDPPENIEVDLNTTKELALSWRSVSGAPRYGLQVSRNRLFVDNIIDVSDRTRNRATLGLRGEGSFVWRVAAIDPAGAMGQWSLPRRFRVTSRPGLPRALSDEPRLEIRGQRSGANTFIISGTTDPGASLTVDGSPVEVGEDGAFAQSIELVPEEAQVIEIRARDPESGREAVKLHQVPAAAGRTS